MNDENMLDLYEELRKIIAALNEHHIEYALCGGLAMAVYERPRATIDIDLMILSEALANTIKLAERLGYLIRGKDLTLANGAVEIRRISKVDPPSGTLLTLDLLLVTQGVQHIWQSRMDVQWEGGKLSVVSRDGLIGLKKMSARPQDLADISALTEDRDATD
jgi:hypothetical protein